MLGKRAIASGAIRSGVVQSIDRLEASRAPLSSRWETPSRATVHFAKKGPRGSAREPWKNVPGIRRRRVPARAGEGDAKTTGLGRISTPSPAAESPVAVRSTSGRKRTEIRSPPRDHLDGRLPPSPCTADPSTRCARLRGGERNGRATAGKAARAGAFAKKPRAPTSFLSPRSRVSHKNPVSARPRRSLSRTSVAARRIRRKREDGFREPDGRGARASERLPPKGARETPGPADLSFVDCAPSRSLMRVTPMTAIERTHPTEQ